ncbi:ferrous iron transport protein B [Phascolarctobacterium succinatutens]|uniref:ferrous iron transport protein B n=1 Tax=Phascolarctobacterium succinatutens TaxID=626940 RepID=UPI003FD6C146
MKQIKIALIGNPNCGKTTMFNDLTGSNQYVGNWPGVTVEKKEGGLKGHDDVIITDLPGIYSLSPYTLEEVVSRNYLLQNDVDGVLNLVDGSNIERNLYLTTQVMEMGYPVTIALNMIDIVRKNGDKIDTAKLAAELGCEIVETSALQGEGTGEAAEKAIKAVGGAAPKYMRFCSEVEDALTAIAREAGNKVHGISERWLLVKLFERDKKIADALGLSEGEQAKIEEIVAACEEALDDDSESIITNERYNYIGELMSNAVVKGQTGLTISDKIDSIVTNRFLALPIFAIIMFLVYYIAVETIGTVVTDFTNDTLFGEWIQPWVQEHMEAAECEDWLVSLVVDGIIGGIGAPIGFAPQMAIVFLLLSFLEDCGYMARVAFIMDRFFRQFGMSGKSFIPLLISAGCGVPGIMASRTIENETDRRLTIMTTTFIPCGAKLPVIALLSGAIMGGDWYMAPIMYFVGFFAVITACIILKKTELFAGDPAPFVMELPAYHWPTVSNILRSMWERGWSFIKKAGTIILLSTIILWFLMSFGWEGGSFGMVEELNESILSKIGTAIAWIFAPLGWTKAGEGWKMAVAAVTGLIAKENVVATFGMLYGFAEVAEDGAEIWGSLAAAMTPIAAYGFLVFNLLCAPCFAAMGAIKREMNNTKWFLFAIGYQCGLAYLVSLCIYQIGTLVTGGGFGIWTVVAFAIIIGFLYLLFRPYKESGSLNVKVKGMAKAR